MEEGEVDSGHDLSWIETKRRKITIPLANRFSALESTSGTVSADNDVTVQQSVNTMEIESESEFKPPEFCLDGVGNVEGMIKKFTALTGENSFSYKCLRDGTVKIQSQSITVYKTLTRFIKDMNLSWYTYQIKSQRSFDVVISGLHKSFKISDLKEFLASKGHVVRSASVMQRKVYDRESEKMITVYMDKFMVHLEPNQSNKDIYSIKFIDHCVVNIEPPHRRNDGPPQCKNCQKRGHTTNFCYRPPVCVKCAGPHHTSKCDINKTDQVKCANCGGHHTANFGGCPDYQQKRRQLRPTTQQRPERPFSLQEHDFAPLPRQANIDPQVRSNFSFADVTSNNKQDIFMKRMEELMVKQMTMLSNLINLITNLIPQICHK